MTATDLFVPRFRGVRPEPGLTVAQTAEVRRIRDRKGDVQTWPWSGGRVLVSFVSCVPGGGERRGRVVLDGDGRPC